MVLPLSHIPSAADARIIWIASESVKRERLEKQGFVPGAVIHCVRRSRHRRFFLFRVNGRRNFCGNSEMRRDMTTVKK